MPCTSDTPFIALILVLPSIFSVVFGELINKLFQVPLTTFGAEKFCIPLPQNVGSPPFPYVADTVGI